MAKNKLPPLLQLSFLLQHSAEEILERDVGVGLSAVRIMSVLSTSAACSQRDVAVHLHQTEANVSRQLQSMKKHGLVNITNNKKDSRQRDVTLSSKGFRKYEQALRTLKKQHKQLLMPLNTTEVKAIESAALKLV
jgi:DNA-binding MarR family transcriptional regulator